MTERYFPCDMTHWTGRSTDPSLGPLYWYQKIRALALDDAENENGSKRNVCLLGYVCDEGVRRNQGRIGAKKGPNAIRAKLARMAYHHNSLDVFDAGDVICNDTELELTQEILSIQVEHLLKHNNFPILLGGGHDMAFGHIEGLRRHLSRLKPKRLGIINFDAHFDLRALHSQANSGTPFYQAAERLREYEMEFHYLVLGIQQEGNTRDLFDIAKKLGVRYILAEEMSFEALKKWRMQLDEFIQGIDHLYISIDMDGFSSAYAPGVSAPSPFGMNPDIVISVLKYLFDSGKVISCDIAEMNPAYDRDEQTASLAARLIDRVCSWLN